jgi:two-component system sensor histidine kinase/response regulator
MATPTETLPAVKVSLKVKTCALLSLVMLAMVTVLVGSFLYQTKATFETARRQYALTLGKHLASHSRQGAFTEDSKLFQSVMDDIQHIPLDLRYAWVASGALPLGLLLCGILASWLCLHYTLAPLQALVKATQRIAAGDVSQQIVVQSHDELGVLANLLNRITASLAHMTERQAQRGGVLAALHHIGAVINATLGQEQRFAPVVKAIGRHFGYDHVRFFLVDTDRQVLVSASAAGTVSQLAALQDDGIPLQDRHELHARVALQGEPALVHDGQYTPEEVYYAQHSTVDIRSLLVVPVQAEGRIFGVLSVVQVAPHRRLTESDRRLVMTLADQMAVAWAHALASQEITRLQTDLQQQQEALLQAKENADAASATKSRFLANISHEIRTPMNGVMGMVDLLLGTSLTAKQRHFAETIRRSGEALLILINDILDFSKIEAGKLELETIDFDIRQTTEDVVELLAEGAHQKGIELVCDVQSTIPTALRGDPLRFRQILTNLIGNAIKFTSHGEVSVRITRVTEERHHIVVRCDVQDTGIGIAADVQTRIFDAFSQADSSTTRQYGGTGLGLAITKQLVDMMHGTLHVDSQPGRGSTFWFTARLDLQPAQPHLSHTMHRNLHGLHALIVDNNASVCAALAHQLEVLGITSDQATTSSQALTMVRTAMPRGRSYDLAFLNMELSDMGGPELAMALRTEAMFPRLPLIMLTPLGHYERDPRLSGAVEYLAKPIRRDQLYKCLIAVMSASGTISLPQDLLLIHAQERTMLFDGRVLLAEDNPVNQEVACEMLTSFGCRIDLAANGEEAVVMASRTAYDMIFMDCQMPRMDGFEATRAIRANAALQQQKHTPVIALTAHAAEEDRKRCLTMGMDDYLSKPFSRDALAVVLRRWLQPRAQHTPAFEDTAEPQRPEAPSSPTAASPGVSPIDTRVFDALRALPRGAASLERVLRTYLSATPPLVAALRDAISRGEAAAVCQAAHSLNSSSANVGALSLAALCQELEAMGSAQALTAAPALLGRVEAEYAAVCVALRQELPNEAA